MKKHWLFLLCLLPIEKNLNLQVKEKGFKV